MSWTKTVNLECDGGEYGCMITPNHAEHDESVAEARETALKHGWGFMSGQDLCPVCIYVRRTGCTCEVQIYEGGRIERLEGINASRGCKVHEKQIHRNLKGYGR
jgi:hypothetical protein